MLSTRVRTLPGQTAAHAWQTTLFSSALVEGGSSLSRIQTDIWSQTCSIGFMAVLRAGQSMTSTSCWSKRLPCHVLYGAGHCLGCTQTYVPPVAHVNIWFPRIRITDDSSWLHPPRPAHSSQMVDFTPYRDWRATISIIRVDAGINQPLPLPTAPPGPTVTVV